MSEAAEILPVIAKCERCGREFVWIPEDYVEMIDPYPVTRHSKRSCGGSIARLEPKIEKEKEPMLLPT